MDIQVPEPLVVYKTKTCVTLMFGPGPVSSDIFVGLDTYGWDLTPETYVDYVPRYLSLALQGATFAQVPNVLGFTQAQAISALVSAQFRVQIDPPIYSSLYPASTVAAQSVAGGSSVPFGTIIIINLSLGAQPVAMPNVVGMTIAAATAQLVATLSANVVVQSINSALPVGTVLAQSIAPGTLVIPGVTVVLTQSIGPVPVTFTPPITTTVNLRVGSIIAVLRSSSPH